LLKKAEKIELTKMVAREISQADGFVICSFQGLTVSAGNMLRRNLYNVGARARVMKNRLLKRALEENNITSMDQYLSESTMIVLGKQDAMAAIKILGDFAKENEEIGFKAGFITGTEYTQAEIIEISKLPGRIELIAMVAGGLNSVLSIFNGTLEALASKKESA